MTVDKIIDSLLLDIEKPENDNVLFITYTINQLICNYNASLIDIEDILREKNSRIFLVAKELKALNDSRFNSFYPGTKNPATHYLWICLHGLNERNEELKQIGITENENYILLMNNTGFLNLKSVMK